MWVAGAEVVLVAAFATPGCRPLRLLVRELSEGELLGVCEWRSIGGSLGIGPNVGESGSEAGASGSDQDERLGLRVRRPAQLEATMAGFELARPAPRRHINVKG